ncbi:hypothetical protein FD754_019226, partial [Muntiacus muntjak]
HLRYPPISAVFIIPQLTVYISGSAVRNLPAMQETQPWFHCTSPIVLNIVANVSIFSKRSLCLSLTLTKDMLNECCVNAHTCSCFLPLQKERVGQMPLRTPPKCSSQLEHRVQTQVRLAKKSFDKLKMDVCQKVDLLGASRCNLLSHMLATYQTTLLHFWEKTSHTMAAIHESFRGYQPYEFTTLKSLQDPMRKLVEKEEKKRIAQQESAEAVAEEPSQLISLEDENQHKESSSFKTEDRKSVLSALDKSSTHNACSDELLDIKPEEGACLGPMAGTPELEGADKDDLLLLSEIFNASSLEEGEFSKEWVAVFGDGRLKEPAPTAALGEPDPRPQAGSGFLPSQLLDQNIKDLQASLEGWSESSVSPSPPWPAPKASSPNVSYPAVREPAKASSDLTAWFSLFADLDPLSNPDAVGKTDKEHELLNA